MLAIPTTRITILDGTATNGFGDTVDARNVVASGVPASLIEQRQTTTRPADRRPQTMRYATCRFDGRITIRPGQRILDENTNIVWQLDDTAQSASFVSTTDQRLRLRRAA